MQNGTIEIRKVAEVCPETESVKYKGRSKTITLGENDIQDIRVELEGAVVYICIQKGRVNVMAFDETLQFRGSLHIDSQDGLSVDAQVNGERMHFSNRETL